MWIVFVGPPGAGKGTQSQRLTEYRNLAHLSTGEALRQAVMDRTEVGSQAEEYMSTGQLVPDSIIYRLVGERLEQPDFKKGCLFDGFPRTIAQAKSFDQDMCRRGTPLDLALELEVDEDVLFTRLSSRGRNDDAPAVIRERLETYYQQTKLLVGYYQNQGIHRSVNGIGTPDEVFGRIKSIVDDLKASGSGTLGAREP